MKKIKFEWESLNDNDHIMGNISDAIYSETYRAKVIGGWLVRHINAMNYSTKKENMDLEGYQNAHQSMVFLSDPNHEWEIDN